MKRITYKLGSARRRTALWQVHREYLRELNDGAPPRAALLRAVETVERNYPDTHGQAARRMRLQDAANVKTYLDRPSLWRAKRAVRPPFPRLFDPQPQPQPAPQPPRPPVPFQPPPNPNAIPDPNGQQQHGQGQPDPNGPQQQGQQQGQGQPDPNQQPEPAPQKSTYRKQWSPCDPDTPIHDRAFIDPIEAGRKDSTWISYAREPAIRAALVEALRERRRGRDLRGRDSGDLDLARMAPTALGLDLDRAFSVRQRPDVRGVAVWIALDGSESMRWSVNESTSHLREKDPRCAWYGAAHAAAYVLRALERERVTCALDAYGNASEHTTAPGTFRMEQHELLKDWNQRAADAIQRIAAHSPDWGTNAPVAVERGARALAQRSEPRRVLMLICDGDIRASDPRYLKAAREGIEIWPLLVAMENTDAKRAGITHRDEQAAEIERLGWSAIPPVCTTPPKMIEDWSRALRAHLGRVRA